MSQAMDMFLGRQNDAEVFGTDISDSAGFSGTQSLTGKHVDHYRAVNMPYYSDSPVMGERRLAIWNERVDAFDNFAAAEAEKKRIDNINLMCDILRSI